MHSRKGHLPHTHSQGLKKARKKAVHRLRTPQNAIAAKEAAKKGARLQHKRTRCGHSTAIASRTWSLPAGAFFRSSLYEAETREEGRLACLSHIDHGYAFVEWDNGKVCGRHDETDR